MENIIKVEVQLFGFGEGKRKKSFFKKLFEAIFGSMENKQRRNFLKKMHEITKEYYKKFLTREYSTKIIFVNGSCTDLLGRSKKYAKIFSNDSALTAHHFKSIINEIDPSIDVEEISRGIINGDSV